MATHLQLSSKEYQGQVLDIQAEITKKPDGGWSAVTVSQVPKTMVEPYEAMVTQVDGPTPGHQARALVTPSLQGTLLVGLEPFAKHV